MVFMSQSTHLVSTINRAIIGPLAKRHPNGVSLLRRADSGPRLDDGWAKAQPAVVLIFKHFRKRGQVSPDRLGEARNQTRAPGLQDICYRRCDSLVRGRVSWI